MRRTMMVITKEYEAKEEEEGSEQAVGTCRREHSGAGLCGVLGGQLECGSEKDTFNPNRNRVPHPFPWKMWKKRLRHKSNRKLIRQHL